MPSLAALSSASSPNCRDSCCVLRNPCIWSRLASVTAEAVLNHKQLKRQQGPVGTWLLELRPQLATAPALDCCSAAQLTLSQQRLQHSLSSSCSFGQHKGLLLGAALSWLCWLKERCGPPAPCTAICSLSGAFTLSKARVCGV